MLNLLFLGSLLIFSAYASFDLLLPPVPPSGYQTQKQNRVFFEIFKERLLDALRSLPCTDEQKSNLSRLLFVYIKARAYNDCAPDFFALEKSCLIANLLFYILGNDLENRDPESDLFKWKATREVQNSYILSWAAYSTNYLGKIIRSFEMLYPDESKALKKFMGQGAVILRGREIH
jgi:hypothetical protein